MKAIKRRIGLGMLAATLLFSNTACNKLLDPTLRLGVNSKEMVFKVKPNSATGDLVFTQQNISVNMDSVMKANNLEWAEVTRASIDSAGFEIVGPEGANFNNIDNAAAYAKTASQPEVKVAYKDNVPHSGLSSIAMDVNHTNLAPYLTSSPMTITLKGHVNAPTTQEITIRGKVKFTIEAQPKL